MVTGREDDDSARVDAILIKETLHGLDIGRSEMMRNSMINKTQATHKVQRSDPAAHYLQSSSRASTVGLLANFASKGLTPRKLPLGSTTGGLQNKITSIESLKNSHHSR